MNLEQQPKAIPFIISKGNDGFELTSEAENFLKSLSSHKLGVICVAGKYRTGKSYFLNKVLLDRKGHESGFSVGPTINPCTKGLWIWNKIIPASKFGGDPGLDLLIVDSEGLAGIDESMNHDTRIFIISVVVLLYLQLEREY